MKAGGDTITAAEARALLGALVVDAGDETVLAAYARAVWSTIVEPGDRIAGELISALGAVSALAAARAGDMAGRGKRVDVTQAEFLAGVARWRPRWGAADEALALARRSGVRLLVPEGASWPHRLDDLGPYAPVCLWVRGDERHLTSPAPTLALVGARAATSYGEHVAGELAAEAAALGISVVSGAAYGIDAAAHSAALRAEGVTIAVMAGGVDRPYPAGNRDLIARIAGSGAVIAEVPCGAAPTKNRFLARNRVIAALSDATVVVEAGWRSGSRNTAHHAQAIGRPVGVVPGPVTSPTSMGCHRLLREGVAECVTGVSDVQQMLGLEGIVSTESRGAHPTPTNEQLSLRDALSMRTARTSEDIARRAGLSYGDTAAALGLMSLQGLVVRQGDGWVHAPASRTTTLW